MHMELSRTRDEDGATTVTLELLESGDLELFYHDTGPAAQRTFGDGDYEAWLRISASDLGRLAFALLAEKYAGAPDALSAMREFCAAKAIPFEAGSWS